MVLLKAIPSSRRFFGKDGCISRGRGRMARASRTEPIFVESFGCTVPLERSALEMEAERVLAEDTETFVNEKEHFEIIVPSGWKFGQGKADGSTKAEGSDRSVFAFYPEGDVETNISVLVTPAAADFTRMGSFGTPYDFGAALVNSLDRGFMKRRGSSEDVQEAKLIDAKEKGGAYIIEYMLKKPQDVPRYYYSSVSMGFDGTYNRLYTATGTCAQSEVDAWQAKLRASIESFKTNV